MSNHRFLLAAVAFIGLFTRAAHAGRPNVPCQSPFVFPDAAVNVVVLPYRESGLPQTEGKGSGTELSLLIQMDVLSHILDHGSVGAVQLEASTPAEQNVCRPEIVGNKLLEKTPGAETTVSPGKGLVLVEMGRMGDGKAAYEEALKLTAHDPDAKRDLDMIERLRDGGPKLPSKFTPPPARP